MEKLIIKAKQGDSSATEAIINEFMPLVINQAYKYKIPSYDYEDVVQHSILSIIKAIQIYEIGDTSFISFVSKIVKNNNVNLLLSKMKHNREVQRQEILDGSADNYLFTLEDEVIAWDMIKSLNKAINKLNDVDRKIIIDFYFKRKDLKSIAAEQGVSYRQIHTLKKNAINNVKKMI
ncbi:sigma-70 family RNA polymerase sigma factor [Clostridium grantii]|uniref:RNA polymerase sigma factor, sigma-70 family n=1 Tax=Clostridium grantii DSM 8605 TaxID=1121316 RepID=A0A1M5XMF1_9CLOT|nr:sigma-70 family RNA polymerase sigma factor [Clostridium grantii]SHI01017.1 RNA polymerase sigma factor, sigma-70 family [Clostridium grantii DSM 8605]